MTNTPLSPVCQTLLQVYLDSPQKTISDEETIRVSEAISSIAFLYEKLRNIVDYKEDHLFRIGAIKRFLSRNIFTRITPAKLSEQLLRELIRSRYLGNRRVPTAKIAQVAQIIDNYQNVLDQLERPDNNLKNWLIDIASSQIDQTVCPQIKESALTSTFYQMLKNNLNFDPELANLQKMRLYIATQKALFKPSLATVRFNLLKGFLPGWEDNPTETRRYFAQNITTIKNNIETQIGHPDTERLTRFCRRYTAPFLILKDILDRQNTQSLAIDDPEVLDNLITETCLSRYSQTRTILSRKAARSIIYIFLTKMVLALLLEFPFDIWIAHRIKILPLVINTLFPPILMFSFVMVIPKPDQNNTQKISAGLHQIIYQGVLKTVPFVFKKTTSNTLQKTIFALVYYLTFFVTFGLIIYVLYRLDFNFFSMLIFLFFLTMVSFFAYKISQTANELIVEEKEKPLALLTDFFLLPIIQAGKRFSSELAKINIFNFILDFFIEAPLKSILEVVEDWLAFIKEKKEELISG